MTFVPQTPLVLRGGLIQVRFNTPEPDANGLITFDIRESGLLLRFPDSAVIHGLRLLDGGEDLFLEDSWEPTFNVVCPAGASFVHNSGAVPEQYRFKVSAGVDHGCDARRYYIFYSKLSGAWRWEVAKWT